MNILVIGGGVIGLTTAAVLREHRHHVTVMAKAWAPEIVSSVAAAIWHPYQVAHPDATRWGTLTAERLNTLMDNPDAGVRAVVGCEYLRHPAPIPDWAEALRFFRRLTEEELPPVEGIVAGFTYEVPLIETPIYLQWLKGYVESLGVPLITRTLASLDDAPADYDVVVNCTGLGARELAQDLSMVAIRGQILKVTPGQVDKFLFDEENPALAAYIIPRTDGTILGGTALYGDEDMTMRDDTTAAIRHYTTALHPELAEAEILDVLVGLRPGRPTVRLEKEVWNGRSVIHNYGHGGAGFTLSWACAEDVALLVSS